MHWYKTTAGFFVPSPGKSAHIQPQSDQVGVNSNNDLNFPLIPFKALVLGSSPSRPTILKTGEHGFLTLLSPFFRCWDRTRRWPSSFVTCTCAAKPKGGRRRRYAARPELEQRPLSTCQLRLRLSCEARWSVWWRIGRFRHLERCRLPLSEEIRDHHDRDALLISLPA